MIENGCIQVYTGNGKGKTTAAVGLGVRAVGCGNKVIMIQFLKGGKTGELKALERLLPDFQVFRFEKPRDFVWNLNEEEKNVLIGEIEKAFAFAKDAIHQNKCNVLILDEFIGVITNGFLGVAAVVEFLKDKPKNVEIIMTGRNVPAEITEVAHYVSQIEPIKHPFEKGISAREGIEF